MEIIFEPETNQEQRNKALAAEDLEDLRIKSKYPEEFIELKTFFRMYKDELFKDPKNANLRKEVHEVMNG